MGFGNGEDLCYNAITWFPGLIQLMKLEDSAGSLAGKASKVALGDLEDKTRSGRWLACRYQRKSHLEGSVGTLGQVSAHFSSSWLSDELRGCMFSKEPGAVLSCTHPISSCAKVGNRKTCLTCSCDWLFITISFRMQAPPFRCGPQGQQPN